MSTLIAWQMPAISVNYVYVTVHSPKIANQFYKLCLTKRAAIFHLTVNVSNI